MRIFIGKIFYISCFCIIVILCLLFYSDLRTIGNNQIDNYKIISTTTENTITSDSNDNSTYSEKSIVYSDKLNDTIINNDKSKSDLLIDVLSTLDLDYKDIANRYQLIVVNINNNGKRYINCYDKINNMWIKNNISTEAHVGINGVIDYDDKVEGDKCTPAGLYSLGYAFGIADNPGTTIEYRKVNDSIYWVDDPKSEYYNMWVDCNDINVLCDSAEHLIDYYSYKYSLVIEYNTNPIIKNKGSAIFLHVGTQSTLGCVSVDENTMINILKWIKNNSNAGIIII